MRYTRETRNWSLAVTVAVAGGLATLALVVSPASAGGPGAAVTARTLECEGLPVTVVGTDRVARGTAGDDVILLTEPGQVTAGGGDDVICGSSGSDTVYAGAGHDRVIGNGGRDHLLGQGDRDELFGGPSRDVVDGGRGFDDVRGGRAGDWLWGGQDSAEMIGGPGVDRYWATQSQSSFRNGSWGVLVNDVSETVQCRNYNIRDPYTDGAVPFTLQPGERYQDGRNGGYDKHPEVDLFCPYWYQVTANNALHVKVTLKRFEPVSEGEDKWESSDAMMPGQSLRLRGWKDDLFAERQRNTANKNALILYYIRGGTLR